MEKKKVKLFSAIALVALALLVVGATYAYFQNQYGSASNADVNVTTYTTDVLTFETGDAVSLEADQTTFGKDKGSASGTTYASALLTANNKTNNAVEHYYLYLNIINNTFTYSLNDNKPELIMTITDKDGNEVKNIEELTYTEVTDRTNKKISGYDITTRSGLITIFNNRELVAKPKAEEKWNITITFVNYEADQNANAGKVLSAKLMIQKNEVVDLISDVCSGGEALSSCITSLSQKSVSNISKIYHHDESLANGAGDNSYRYAGRDEVPHPAYYSCKYKGMNVSNVDGEINKSLRGDCNEVSIIFPESASEFVNKTYDEVLATKVTGQWDAANNKCVTPSGDNIVNLDGGYIPEILCSKEAVFFQNQWIGGIKIEELGPGVETLEQPADEENQKPALYSCTYNGNAVVGTSEDNLSLKGECSTVYKISILGYPDLIDKSFEKSKLKVKWDDENNKCVTSLGNLVSSLGGGEITEKKQCVGEAYKYNDKWIIGLTVDEIGAGIETLAEPEIWGVNNYVCFGASEAPCPEDNLYRIIGVFGDKVKLIKSDYATTALLGTDGDYKQAYKDIGQYSYRYYYKGNNYANIAAYYWNKSGQNTWSLSNLNKINLNQNFITNIGAEWANKIDMTTWKVGGTTWSNIGNQPAKTAYQNEIVNPVTTNSTDNKTEYSAKIGLMYASDYGFAAAPSAWTTTLFEYDDAAIKNVNWMHMGLMEWTISRSADDSVSEFYVESDGDVYSFDGGWHTYAVRPVFYLTSSVNYVSGSGTATDPIRIN